MSNKNKKNNLNESNKLSEKQKRFLFGATTAGIIVLNVGISIFQIFKARRK